MQKIWHKYEKEIVWKIISKKWKNRGKFLVKWEKIQLCFYKYFVFFCVFLGAKFICGKLKI